MFLLVLHLELSCCLEWRRFSYHLRLSSIIPFWQDRTRRVQS